jgi:hypothetical protein
MDRTGLLERIANALDSVGSNGGELEAKLQACVAGVRGQPRRRSPSQPALFLRAHHLQRIAEPRVFLGFDLAEDQRPATADDEVELVAADPGVRFQDAIAAEAVVPQYAPLGAVANRTRATRR